MQELDTRREVTRQDLLKNKALQIGAWSSPIIFAAIPALIFFILFIFSSATPTAATFFFLSLISLIVGFIFGLMVTAGISYYRSGWLSKLRESLAIDGIKANEVEWFKNELKTSEKKSLKEIESKNLLLADAFRDTLAARLTATRILKTTKKELLLVKRRQTKLKNLKSENSANLQEELNYDVEKLEKINSDAAEMLTEAETRLQMIEAVSRRGTNLADSELALKKLAARTSELPLALESAKMEEEIRRELEQETDLLIENKN